MKLSIFIHKFFDHYLCRIKGSSKQTIKSYRETFTLFIRFAANNYKIKVNSLTINHISIDLILDFLDYLESERSNTARTRNQRLAVLKSFAKMIRLFYPEHMYLAERINNIPQKRTQSKIVGFLYIEEILMTYKVVDLKKMNGFRDYTILHLLSDSGVRASELAMLKLDYFNSGQKTLGILGKGNKYRLIELEKRTSDLIKRYITDYRPTPKSLYKERLFINKHKKGLTRKGVYLLCKKYLYRALSAKRMKNINPVHSFRHSCAVNMLAQGMSLPDIKNRLGHASIESTKVYLHLDLKNKRKVQKQFIEYMQTSISQDTKIDELVDWENKTETLAWLDSL